jgi:DNA-binding Xre family transcriptional regulator
MPLNPHPQRRDFLKTAAAGAAGAMGLGALKIDKLFAQSSGGWVSGMQINPAIDNKRVICCHDTNMLTGNPTNGSFTGQNDAVNANLVVSNMDQMAMQLAQKTAAADAWSTIFQKPASKTWADTKVAIKTNAIGGTNANHPRVAIIKKICDVLVDQLGVQPANIVVYDANSDASTMYTTYASLTDSTKIRAVVSKLAQSLGNMVGVTITTASKTMTGVGDLVNGVTDILVNISVLKYHGGPSSSPHPLFGSCSMCMKNHLGTFINSGNGTPSATGLHTLEAILEINKHPAVLGGSPVRQQLCIVDCLLANSSNAGGNYDTRVDRIVMGTFAPTVDYLTAKNVLFNPTAMGGKVVTDYLNNYPQFLTSFGYAETDPLQWVELGAGGTSTGAGGAGGGGGTSGAGGARSGGTTAAGGTPASGGTSAAGGAGTGGTSGAGGARSGGTSAAGGVRSGGTSATGGAGSGGASAMGGAGSGGTTAAGGTPASGGTTSGGTGGTGGAATSAASASGGSATTGGTTSGNGAGGSSGTAGTTSAASNSGSGCDVVGLDRRATRWGAVLAFGAVVAEKLRRLVSSGDRSS